MIQVNHSELANVRDKGQPLFQAVIWKPEAEFKLLCQALLSSLPLWLSSSVFLIQGHWFTLLHAIWPSVWVYQTSATDFYFKTEMIFPFLQTAPQFWKVSDKVCYSMDRVFTHLPMYISKLFFFNFSNIRCFAKVSWTSWTLADQCLTGR